MGLSLIFCVGSQVEDTKKMLEALEADYQALNQRRGEAQSASPLTFAQYGFVDQAEESCYTT